MELPSLEVFERRVDVALRISGGLGSYGCTMVGVNDLEGFPQPKQFYDSKDTAYGQLEPWTT